MAKYTNFLIPCLALLYLTQVHAQSDAEGELHLSISYTNISTHCAY